MSDDPFVTHRSLLFTVAYEMLGSAADAEDVVQETWLRWAGVDQADVRDPRAYLVRIVTRQALDRLRTLARRREEYVGVWLPEPLLTSPDVAEDVELAESVSIAMLTVLETLGPVERAVFLLREVFDVPYDEIARDRRQERGRGAADRPPRARARDRAQTADVGEPRRTAGGGGALPSRAHDRRPPGPARRPRTRRGAGGRRRRRRPRGHPPAVRREDGGAAAGPLRRVSHPSARVETTWLNGAPALRIDPGGEFDTAVSLTVEGGRITRIYAIRNPHKLAGLDRVAVLTR